MHNDQIHFSQMAFGNGHFKSNPSATRRRARCPQLRDGVCTAALRAFSAAKPYLSDEFDSLGAARACGSNAPYVAAAIVLIRSENTAVQQDVLAGRVSLLPAAHQLRKFVRLVAAFREASASDRVMFGCVVGPTNLFENSVAPAL
jgi:hypothetical protein